MPCARWLIHHIRKISEMASCSHSCLMLCSEWGHVCFSAECADCFFFLTLCVCESRVMGRSHPVRGGPPAPAPTAPWAATDATPRVVPPRITADQVSTLIVIIHMMLLLCESLYYCKTWSLQWLIANKMVYTVFGRKYLLQVSQTIHHFTIKTRN